MDVAMLWIRRPDSDIPELVAAWDGYSIEENYDGWEKACQRALDEVKGDLAAYRYVNVKVSDQALDELFREFQTISSSKPTSIEGPADV